MEDRGRIGVRVEKATQGLPVAFLGLSCVSFLTPLMDRDEHVVIVGQLCAQVFIWPLVLICQGLCSLAIYRLS